MILILITLIAIQHSEYSFTNAIDPPTGLGRAELRTDFFKAIWDVRHNTNYNIVIQRSSFSFPTIPPSTPDVTSPYAVARTSAGELLQPNMQYDIILFAINPSNPNDFTFATIKGITTTSPSPTNVRVTDVSTTTFVISWNHDATGQRHTTAGYQVMYTSNGGTSQTKQTNRPKKSLTIDGLTPNTDYTVRVRVTFVIKDAFTLYSTPLEVFTLPDRPTTPVLSQPTGSSADPSTMIKLDWNKPYGGDAIDDYTVAWKLTTSSSYNSSATVAHIVRTTSYSYIINNLIPGGSYYVRVRARNSAGAGQPSLTATHITELSSFQYNVAATKYEFNISWNRPDGVFDGFGLELFGFQNISLGPCTSSYIIRKLNSSTAYTMQIYSFVQNIRRFSTPRTFTTLPARIADLHLNQPVDPTFDLTTMIKLDWNKPDGGDAIDNYTLEWKLSTASNYNSSATVSHVVGTTSFSYIINNLIPGGSYDVRVRARNSAGDSQSSIRSNYITKPSPPQYNITVSSNQLFLTWNRPVGFFDGFVVELIGYRKIKLNATVRHYNIRGLNSSTEYKVLLYSSNSNTDSVMDRRTFRTSATSLISEVANTALIIGILCALVIVRLVVGVWTYRRQKLQTKSHNISNDVELKMIAENNETGDHVRSYIAADKDSTAVENFDEYMKDLNADESSAFTA